MTIVFSEDSLVQIFDFLSKYGMKRMEGKMISSLKVRKLTIKEHLNIIFCRHITTIIILTIGFGVFAFFTHRNILLTAIAGFIFGVTLNYLLKSFDSTLKTPEDVEHCVRLPCLGYIPPIEKNFKNIKNIDLVSHHRYYSSVAEAFRKVKTALLATHSPEKPFKAFVVSSFIPKEGKSFVATNLAITFAAAGEPTLLIDADMRKGRISEIFGIGSERGLSNTLAGASSFHEGVVSTNIENLSVLPLGVASPNPIELLKVDKIKAILQEAGTKFRKIIIDTPPVLSVTDALVFGRECDGLIFVIKAGVTPFQYIIDAKKMIGNRAKILGALLNGVDAKKSRD
ncbi:MAG: polysaccharide biosynthesis tyrosine autokinase [Candidatus Omnitrophica bacterium]|nr:polysaccharide biosynthesis tyrosine autokinase [Candidatus Omnitrophota bacterium]